MLFLAAFAARADVFELEGGGEVRGELVNRTQSPRTTYEIRIAGGGEILLDADQVKQVRRQSAREMEYDRIRGDYADTIEGQWALAEWCRENYLGQQRKKHLERIIEIDPDHAAARRGLGYTQVRGRWVTQEMQMIENGYVRYKGDWVLPQEIELLERESKIKSAQLEWNAKLKRWHGWLSTNRAAEAEANIKAIQDPFAAAGLARYLSDPKSEDTLHVRLLYVEALGRLNEAAGLNALVAASLHDEDEEVRLAALDEVAERKYQPAVVQYIKALRDADNAIINRAAIGLAALKDTRAIGPLIDALVTTHTYQVQDAPAGQMSSTFGTGSNGGPGTFSFGGGGPKTVKQSLENREVLQALVVLSGGVSFNYDRTAWRYWQAGQKTPQKLDARRD